MAYYSGQVSSFTELRDVLTDSCVANGWTWADGILSKNDLFISVEVKIQGLKLTGGTGKIGATLLNPSPIKPGLGNMGTAKQPTFPLTYHLFIFADEVYFKVKFDVDGYYHLAFGKSNISLPSTGLWLTANANYNNSNETTTRHIYVTEGTGGINSSGNSAICPTLPFWVVAFGGASYEIYYNSTILTGLDGALWSSGSAKAYIPACMAPLQTRQPSNWNGEAIFLPLAVYRERSSSKLSQVCQFQNARFVRIDNYEPEQIVILGAEKWMIFPFYRKNISSRNGGNGIDHTGTLGWAIRYDGP